MKGFFKKEEVQSVHSTKGKTLSCFTCGLSRNINSPKLESYGLFKKKILIITGAPTDSEDEFGKRWAGNSFFKLALSELNIDLYEDCLTIGAVNCRPPKGRSPKPHEFNCCRHVKVLPELSLYKPKLILVLGTEGVVSILGDRWKKELGTINKWRGWQIPDVHFDAWVCPIFHPNYVQKTHSQIVSTIWKQDLKKAISHLSLPFPIYGKITIEYITDLSILNKIKSKLIVFDLETTGVKPQYKKQRIVSAAVAPTPNMAYAFLLPKKKKERSPFLKLLTTSKIKKIAQNFKYEDNWIMVKLFKKVKGWIWDTMIAAHLQDNRKGVTGLKFQTYVLLGVIDYDSSIAPFLKAKKGGNELNKIDKLLETKEGVRELLKYNALDCIYAYRIALLQRKQFGYDSKN